MKRLSYVSVVLMLPAVLLSGCGGGSSTVSVAPPAVGRQTHTVNLTGELDVSSPPLTQRITVYDAHFNPHSLVINLTSPIHNPAPGAGVPTNATQQWDVQITLEGMVQPTQKLFAVPNGSGGNTFLFADTSNPANSLGSTLILNVPGSNGAPAFPLSVNFSGLKASSNVTSSADGRSTPTPVQTTVVSFKGNLNLDGSAPVSNQAIVYKADGSPFTVTTTFSNPTYSPAPGSNVPAQATQQWDVKIVVDTVPPTGPTTVYDSSVGANNESKVYFAPGLGFILANGGNPATSLGSAIQVTANAFPAGSFNQGLQTTTGFPFSISLSNLTTTAVTSAGDGQGN